MAALRTSKTQMVVFCPVCDMAIEIVVTCEATADPLDRSSLIVECNAEPSPAAMKLHAPCIEGSQ